MTKYLWKALISLYDNLASRVLPIEEHSNLCNDLEKDPFLNEAMGVICCKLYYEYGPYLAPITTAITIAKYCKCKDNKDFTENNIVEKSSYAMASDLEHRSLQSLELSGTMTSGPDRRSEITKLNFCLVLIKNG